MKTPWIIGDPVRKGVYERDYFGNKEYAYWTGAQWNFGRKTVGQAASMVTSSRFQDLPWRGLTEEAWKTTQQKERPSS